MPSAARRDASGSPGGLRGVRIRGEEVRRHQISEPQEGGWRYLIVLACFVFDERSRHGICILSGRAQEENGAMSLSWWA